MVRVDLRVRRPAGWLVREYRVYIPDHEDLIVLFAFGVLRSREFCCRGLLSQMATFLLYISVLEFTCV